MQEEVGLLYSPGQSITCGGEKFRQDTKPDWEYFSVGVTVQVAAAMAMQQQSCQSKVSRMVDGGWWMMDGGIAEVALKWMSVGSMIGILVHYVGLGCCLTSSPVALDPVSVVSDSHSRSYR